MSSIRALRAIRPAAFVRPTSARPVRSFSLSVRRAKDNSGATSAENNTPQTAASGSQSGDAFQKREQASENMYIQKQLQEKLNKLKAQVKEAENELNQSGKK